MTRTIRTGRTVIQTRLTVDDIASLRPTEDPELFQRKFRDYWGVAKRLALLSTAPLEVETLAFIARLDGPVQEAALIEALASLRAEGVRL